MAILLDLPIYLIIVGCRNYLAYAAESIGDQAADQRSRRTAAERTHSASSLTDLSFWRNFWALSRHFRNTARLCRQAAPEIASKDPFFS